MATTNPRVQLEATFSAEGVREGTNEAKQAVTDMANTVGQQAQRTAKSLDSLSKASADMAQGVSRGVSAVGDGVQAGAVKFTRGEATMASAMRRLTEQALAATKVGSSIADSFQFKIDQRGLDSSKFTGIITSLRDAEAALASYKAREAEVAAQNAFAVKHQQAKELVKASEYANWWAESLKKVEDAERRVAGQSNFLSGLKSQADSIGKTRSQLLEMQAAQLGVSAQAAPMIAKLREQEAQFTQTGMSAKATAAALRGVPAQFTDIFVSLQGGMNPMTVLLQQGGQLKDMFGGIGPAARAMGGYVLGLVNPFTLTAAAAGALAFAMYKTESSLKAANSIETQIRATGRGADISREQIASLRKELQELPGVTKAFATATITEFARTRQIGGELFRDLALNVADFAAAAGTQAPDAARVLARAFADPAQGAKQLDEQLGILSASQLVTIQNMVDLGDKAGAQKVLLEALQGTIKGLADQGLTPLGKATTEFGNAWDTAMRNLGDPSPLRAANVLLAEMIGYATWLLNNLPDIKLPEPLKGGGTRAGSVGLGMIAGTAALGPVIGPHVGGYLAMRAATRTDAPSTGGASGGWDDPNADWEKQKKDTLALGAGFKSTAAAAADLSAKAVKLNSVLTEMRKRGEENTTAYKEMKGQLDGVNEKIEAANKKGGAAARQEQSAYEKLIASINGKIAANEEELKFGDKVTEADKLRVKMLAELAAGSRTMTEAHKAEALSRLGVMDAQEKEKLARAESVAKAKEMLEMQAELQAASVAESKAREAGQQALNGWLKGIEQANQATEVEIAGIGRSTAERQKLIDKYQVQIDLERQLLAIKNNPGYTSDEAREVEYGRARGGAADAAVGKEMDAAAKRLNELLDPDRAKDFGEALADAFEGALSPMKKMGDALSAYAKQQAKTAQGNKDLDELWLGFKKTSEEINGMRKALDKQDLEAQIGLWGSLAGSAAGFFKEGTTGFQTMSGLSKAFYGIQMAEQAASVAMVLAGEKVKQGEFALSALAASLGITPPLNFIMFGAVAALLAGIGISAGGGGGGGGGGYTGIAAGGTGTVLGMEGEQSESIGNAIEILADNSKIELAYTQKMLSELTKVKEGILGLAGTASTDFFIRGFAGASFGDDFLDSGIGFFPGQSVADIIEKGVQGVGFNLIFQNGAQAMWKALDEQFTSGVGAVLKNVADVVFTAADALGLNDAALAERMLSLIPTLGDTSTYGMNGITQQGGGLVSLKDMSGEEIQKELEAIFSAVGDQMAAAALPALKPFQVVGEGMFETLIKVTTGIETAGYALEKFGLNAIDYTEIVRKQGDVAVEIIRQTIMGAEQELAMYRYGSAGTVVSGATPQTGLSSIIEDFVGDASELEELYSALLDVRKAMKSVGMDALDLSRDMIRGAGGLETLQSGLDSYFENFFTEEEKLAAKTARLAEDFQRIGVAVPVGIEGFRAAVDQADAYLKGQLMGVAEAFYEVASASETAKTSLADIVADMVGRASDFLTPGQMQAGAVRRIQTALQEGGAGFNSFEQILGYSRAQFTNDIQAYYAAGNETMVRLMHSIADDYLSISQSTVDALQAQQSEASQTVDALKADVDKWAGMRKSAQDLSRSIGLSMTGGTGEADLWATVNGKGALEERIKAATELKALIERTAGTQVQAWQTSLAAAQSMLGIGKQLKGYVDGLKLGNLSALTPSEQMAEARNQLVDTYVKATQGDADAQRNLQSVASSYLTLAQQYDPNAYGATFNEVTQYLEEFAGSLISDGQAEADRQQALISAAETANGLTAEQITKLTTLQTAVDSMVATADVKITTTNAELAIANGKLSVIEGLLSAANNVWTYLPEQADSLAKIDVGLGAVVETLLTLPREFARSIAAVVGVDVASIPGFASGGVHAGGWRMVGERGPELEFTGPSRIYSAAQSAQMLGGGNAELLAELRAVKAELVAVKATIAQGDQMNAQAALEGGRIAADGAVKGAQIAGRTAEMKKRAVAA